MTNSRIVTVQILTSICGNYCHPNCRFRQPNPHQYDCTIPIQVECRLYNCVLHKNLRCAACKGNETSPTKAR